MHEALELVQLGFATHGSQPIERYRLQGIWCLHFYNYKAIIRIDDHEFPIAPGDVSLCPPSHRLAYAFRGPSRHLFAHFRWKTSRKGISTPAVQTLARQPFERLKGSLESVLVWFGRCPVRANVRLWDVLWELSGNHPATGENPIHPAVLKTLEIIDRRLAETLGIEGILREVEISHGHLLRLFRNYSGKTLGEYIRHRRMERARYLLSNTTLPVKAVAVECGIPDLHLFNKTVRRELGTAPRAFRERASGWRS